MSKLSTGEIQEKNEDEARERRTSPARLGDITERQVSKKVSITRSGAIIREENDHSLS